MVDQWAESVGQEFEFDDWEEFLGMLLASGGGETLYRGHREYDWRLESRIERALLEYAEKFDERTFGLMQSMSADPATAAWAIRVERSLTQYFRTTARSYGLVNPPAREDQLGWWEVMQHHGAPTRLLDWTTSPFVALWFALEKHNSGDMALWICDRRNLRVNHHRALSRLQSLEEYGALDEREQLNRYVDFAMEDGNPSFIAIQPRQFPRVVSQQSVLTVVPKIIGVGRPAYLWIRERLATRVRIREAWKDDIAAACQSMGLSRHGLFRDLDSLGAHMTQSFIDQTGGPWGAIGLGP